MKRLAARTLEPLLSFGRFGLDGADATTGSSALRRNGCTSAGGEAVLDGEEEWDAGEDGRG